MRSCRRLSETFPRGRPKIDQRIDAKCRFLRPGFSTASDAEDERVALLDAVARISSVSEKLSSSQGQRAGRAEAARSGAVPSSAAGPIVKRVEGDGVFEYVCFLKMESMNPNRGSLFQPQPLGNAGDCQRMSTRFGPWFMWGLDGFRTTYAVVQTAHSDFYDNGDQKLYMLACYCSICAQIDSYNLQTKTRTQRQRRSNSQRPINI